MFCEPPFPMQFDLKAIFYCFLFILQEREKNGTIKKRQFVLGGMLLHIVA
jgi:hypothetical protein